MTVWARAKSLIRKLFHKHAVEEDLDEEVRTYMEMAAEERMDARATAGEDRRMALAEVGGTEQLKQAVREQRVETNIDSVVQDLRYGVRQVVKSPGFGFAMILTLALSIGITATVFSVLYSMLIRPLPYRDGSQIVALETRSAGRRYPAGLISGICGLATLGAQLLRDGGI